jgi:hypothetical protein
LSNTLDSIDENIACFINSSNKSNIEVLTSSYETIQPPQQKKRGKFLQQIYEKEREID